MMKTILVAFLIVLVASPAWGFDCLQAKTTLAPCVDYLTGAAPGDPSPACCNGVKTVKASVPTRDDRRAACVCLKDAAAKLPGLKPDLAASLPKKCGVDLGFDIGVNTKCDSIPSKRMMN